VGNEIIAGNGRERVLCATRVQMLLVALQLGAAIYWWSRQILGETAARGALWL